MRSLLPADAIPDDAAIDGAVTIVADGYRLQLQIRAHGQLETREVVSNDCALLARTAAIVAAITIDAVAAAQAVADADRPPPQTSETVAVSQAQVAAADPLQPPSPITTAPAQNTRSTNAPPPPVRNPTPRRPTHRWHHGIEAMAAGGVGLGLVPRTAAVIEGSVGWRYGPIRVRAGGFHWFARTTELQDNAGVSASVSGGLLEGCFVVGRSRFEVPLCVGPQIAALRGRGIGGAVDPQATADTVVALAFGAGWHWRFGDRFALGARLQIAATVRRPALHLERPDGLQEIFRIPPLGFRLLLVPSVHSR